jgi:hypothetical protein
LPRWRKRRESDIAVITIAYTIALAAFAALTMVELYAPEGLLHRPPDLAAKVLIAFLVISYFVLGGAVVALASRRIAKWTYRRPLPLRLGRLAVFIWPISVGSLVFEAAVLSGR